MASERPVVIKPYQMVWLKPQQALTHCCGKPIKDSKSALTNNIYWRKEVKLTTTQNVRVTLSSVVRRNWQRKEPPLQYKSGWTFVSWIEKSMSALYRFYARRRMR
jgi:hypothetical protein